MQARLGETGPSAERLWDQLDGGAATGRCGQEGGHSRESRLGAGVRRPEARLQRMHPGRPLSSSGSRCRQEAWTGAGAEDGRLSTLGWH